ncbi:lysophospholipid acyltransferase family protein [Tengunoibacter tsumagoiensis]|uniref:Phospholipid/glycerol acyltransferase domain-containing protein n=1 Tax=Tengunoibacter tsumagoiensis TaxID=2014871 RepID=A0A402A9X9_9CHLR|nr:lysophospholipid acyltransferase family protein [Tengunoibacter tsumagoiensis]GCE15972.1 hypothetical protein KTT_58310 [Tengunoibacter tsumagoiensis]
MYYFFVLLGYLIIPLFCRLHIVGHEHIPRRGAVVLTCNHQSWIDVIILAFAIRPRVVHYMAKQELLAYPILGPLLAAVHVFPVNREHPGPSAIKVPLALLKQGAMVGIFPTGTRTSEDVALKQGAITIAFRAQAPLITANYTGPTSMHWSFLFKRPEVTVRFWPAISIPEGNDKKQAMQMMMEKMTSQLKANG